MRLGIVTPVLTRLTRAHAAWEANGGIEDVARIAVEAERLGYEHLTCSEHVALPTAVTATRGATYWDPLATFGYLAAKTERIRFATFVLVLGYHHPLSIVKRYGTLDRIAGGRLILGVGVGSLKEEFELIGAPFAGRGARGDDAIRAIRAAWGREKPEYRGSHYHFNDFVVDPTAPRTEVPIWIGGRTERSLRRAVELGECWSPFGLTVAEIGDMVRKAKATAAWAARKTPLDVGLQTDPVDPLGDRAATLALVEQCRAAGTTVLNLRLVSSSIEHYCEQLAAMRELVPMNAHSK